jgi:hypothetical protein
LELANILNKIGSFNTSIQNQGAYSLGKIFLNFNIWEEKYDKILWYYN